jgi:hypothetical protein
MRKQAPIQYTIRGIPPEVDKALREKAAERGLSLNQTIVEELVGATVGREKKSALSDLVGQWEPDPGFDEIIASQRQVIDWEKWK